MSRAKPNPFGLDAPRPVAAVVAAALAAAFIAAQPADLATIARFGDWDTTPFFGALQLAWDAAISLGKVVTSMGFALIMISTALALTLNRPSAMGWSRNALAIAANAPVLMLLPMWVVAFGNSETAALAFLSFCFTTMIGFLVFDDRAGGAVLAQRVTSAFPLPKVRRLMLVLEIVITAMRLSIFQILVLGLPLALAAELIANQSGLGHIASSAFLNGDFTQLSLAAAMYVVAFCFLWLVWALILRAPFLSGRRKHKE